MQVVTYFIQAENGGPIKIGKSTAEALTSRLSSIQTGNPARLVVRHVLEGNLESELHHRFAAARLTGEWFAPVPELVEVAHALTATGLDTTSSDYVMGHSAGWVAAVEHTFAGVRDAVTATVQGTLDREQDLGSADAEFFAAEHRRRPALPTSATHVHLKAA